MRTLIFALLLAAQAWATFTPAKTCGVVTVSGGNGSVSSNYKYANRFTCPDMTVKRGHVLQLAASGADPAAKVRMVIYSAASGPTSLVATSDEITGITNSQKWLDFTFSTPAVLMAGDYYIGYIYQSTATLYIAILATGGTSAYNSDTYADGPAATFGSATTGSIRGHIYVESDPSGPFGGTTCGGAPSWANNSASAFPDNKYAGIHPCPSLLVTDGYDWQYGDAPAGTKLKMLVYADSGGAPGALLATSNEVTTGVIGEETRWLHFTFTPFRITAGNYWIAIIVYASSSRYFEVMLASSNPSCWNADTYADGASNPFGSCNASTGLSAIYLEGQALGNPSAYPYIM